MCSLMDTVIPFVNLRTMNVFIDFDGTGSSEAGRSESLTRKTEPLVFLDPERLFPYRYRSVTDLISLILSIE